MMQTNLHTDTDTKISVHPLVSGVDDPNPCVTIDVQSDDGTAKLVVFLGDADTAWRFVRAAQEAHNMLRRVAERLPVADRVVTV